MADDMDDKRTSLAALSLFAVIAMLIFWDLLQDYSEGAGWLHIGIELTMLLAATTGIGFLWRGLGRARTELAQANLAAGQWQAENRELILGLGVAIENQFARWELTKAEAEVGLLLLKGLSHKEIAEVRGTAERTTREQARTVYRKAGLSGRSALSAFFLEDLLPGQPA